jgi:hypothetical protein
MVRGIAGFAGFFLVLVLGMKLIGFILGGLLGLVFKVLWFAFLGWLIYKLIRVFSPSTADRIRDTIKGKESEA